MTAQPSTPARESHAALTPRDAFSFRRNLRALVVPSPAQILPLDGMRALAVVWIVAYHTAFATQFFIDPVRYNAIEFSPAFKPVTLAAHYALDIFFVLSGFLIAQLLLSEKKRYGTIALPRFYARRAMRLLPAYYPALFFLYLCEPSQVKQAALDFNHILGVDWFVSLPFPNWVSNLLYFNNFLPWDRQYMGWSWTLAIEEQFYITFPLLLLFLHRRNWNVLRTFMGLFLLAFVVRAIVSIVVLPHSDVQNALFVKTHTRYGSIQLGVLCAYYHVHVSDRAARRRFAFWIGLWPILFAVAVVAWKRIGVGLGVREIAIRSAHHYMIGSLVAWAIMNVIEKDLSPTWRRITHVLSNRVLFVMAQVSYSTYLLHLTIMGAVYKLVAHYHPFGLTVPDTIPGVLAWAVLFEVLCFGAAVPMYLFVEHPAMVLRNIWFKRPSTVAAASPPVSST